MTPFAAALSTLCLTAEEAATLLPSRDPDVPIKVGMVRDMARGKTRVPNDVWTRLGVLFEMVEQAADEIIADQAVLDGGAGIFPLTVDAFDIDLPHASLQMAALARARLVMGRTLVLAEVADRQPASR